MSEFQVTAVDASVAGEYKCDEVVHVGADAISSALYETELKENIAVNEAFDFLRKIAKKSLTDGMLKLSLLCLCHGNATQYDKLIAEIEKGIVEKIQKVKEKNPQLPQAVSDNEMRKLQVSDAHREKLLVRDSSCRWVQSAEFISAVETIIKNNQDTSKHNKHRGVDNESIAIEWATLQFKECSVISNVNVVVPKGTDKPNRGVKMEMDAIVIDKDNVLKAIVESKSSSIHLWQDLEKSSALVEFLGKITSDTGKITIALHGKRHMDIEMPNAHVELHYVIKDKQPSPGTQKLSLEHLFKKSFHNDILLKDPTIMQDFAEKVYRAKKAKEDFGPKDSDAYAKISIDVPLSTQEKVSEKAADNLESVRADMHAGKLHYWLHHTKANVDGADSGQGKVGGDAAAS